MSFCRFIFFCFFFKISIFCPSWGKEPTPPPPNTLGSFLLRTLEHTPQEKTFESIFGNPHAPIVIVVYGSLSCSACADVHKKAIDPLLAKYKDKICFVVKDYPIDGPSTHAMLLTWCLPEKAVALRRSFYVDQEKWANAEDFKTALKKIAAHHGLTDNQCELCFSNQELLVDIVKFRVQEKEGANLTHVPLIFLIHRESKTVNNAIMKVTELTDPAQLEPMIKATLPLL